MSMSVCVNLQGAVLVILYVYACLCQLTGGSGGILYVYVCLCQPTGGSGGNLVCLCLFVSTDRGQWW